MAVKNDNLCSHRMGFIYFKPFYLEHVNPVLQKFQGFVPPIYEVPIIILHTFGSIESDDYKVIQIKMDPHTIQQFTRKSPETE